MILVNLLFACFRTLYLLAIFVYRTESVIQFVKREFFQTSDTLNWNLYGEPSEAIRVIIIVFYKRAKLVSEGFEFSDLILQLPDPPLFQRPGLLVV